MLNPEPSDGNRLMQVTCSHCGARYEFDAAAIPEGGYDAQCTQCQGVFFVQGPKASESAAPAAQTNAAATPAAQTNAVAAPAAKEITLSCPNCQALYQFDVAAIPPDGYDAQCTQCQAVFFVSREGSSPATANVAAQQPEQTGQAPAEPAGADTPRAAAADANAAAAAAQPGSHDASTQGATATTASTHARQPANTAAEPMPQLAEYAGPTAQTDQYAAGVEAQQQAPAADAEPVDASALTVAPAAESPGQSASAAADGAGQASASRNEPAAAASKPSMGGEPERHGGAGSTVSDDLLQLSDQLGEPSATEADADVDFEQILARRRKRWFSALGGVGALVAISVALYFALPTVFDATVGPLIGVKAAIHPDAIPHFENGRQVMLADTAEAYDTASEHFKRALQVDDLYPQAVALAGLAKVFRGNDLKAQGQRIRDRGSGALSKLKELKDLPKRKRPRNFKRRVKSLQAKIDSANDDSGEYFERGGALVSEGFARLKEGLKQLDNHPAVVQASGIYYAAESDDIGKAEEFYDYSVNAHGGSLDLQSPPNIWLPYLKGRLAELRAGDEKARPQAAVEAYEAALAVESGFQRARFRLAAMHYRAKDYERAKKMAQTILDAQSEHGKAKRLVQRIEDAVNESKAASAKKDKRRAQRRRGRRRRRRR